MSDKREISIVNRLEFDATRCELQFSKGVAGNIREAAAEIGRLRAAKTAALRIADERAIEAAELRAKLESARKTMEAAKEFVDDEFGDCNDLPRKYRIMVLGDMLKASLSDEKGESP